MSFGQLLKSDVDKTTVIKTLEKSGCSHGTRIHTSLTEAHSTILSRHIFYVAARRRTPSWWLVLCKSGSNFLSVLVEPTKKPEFPYPRMYLWPGRWEPVLYSGTVFAVQCHDAEFPILTIEDTVLCPAGTGFDSVSWSETPFSVRWKTTQVIYHTMFKHDETVNAILTELRDYHALKDFKRISGGVPYVEFVPEDAGRKRFLLPGRPSVPLVSQVLPVPPSEQPKIIGGLDKYRKPTIAIYGISRDVHPDVYILHKKCGGKPEQLKQADGTPQYAAIQTLSTSRTLRLAFDANPTDVLVWNCRWITSFSKWEPFELIGSWLEHGTKVATT